MIHLPMSPLKCKNALFISVLGILALALCLAVAFGQEQEMPPLTVPGSGEHEQNLDGYCELAEAVLIKKMNLLKFEIEALEERVTKLEEKNE